MGISDTAGQVKIERSACWGHKLRPRGIPVKKGRILAEEPGAARRDDREGGSLRLISGEEAGYPGRRGPAAPRQGRGGRVWSSRRGLHGGAPPRPAESSCTLSLGALLSTRPPGPGWDSGQVLSGQDLSRGPVPWWRMCRQEAVDHSRENGPECPPLHVPQAADRPAHLRSASPWRAAEEGRSGWPAP